MANVDNQHLLDADNQHLLDAGNQHLLDADNQHPFDADNQHLLLCAFRHNADSQEACHAYSENVNNYGRQETKRYLVYMELPKILMGDYHKPSCVVGNILRFHFLMKIAINEDSPLTLLPIKKYKIPVVNVAVIHRPFIEDDTAKGPIPKSPGMRSPLIRYSAGEDASDTQADLVEDFRRGTADTMNGKDHDQDTKEYNDRLTKEANDRAKKEADDRDTNEINDLETKDHDKKRHGKKRKKYFVYCELPKVALGDYRMSSVTSSEMIHCHFLMKVAKDEANGQPVLRPIKKYRRPRVNFAVIHRSLIVDDEAAGPIPRSPGVKSPMIKEDMDGDDDMDFLHTTMGFNYGEAPRSKYELVSQWSLVADESGRIVPELVLSKANC